MKIAMSNPMITLTTDFGLKDPYVAEMKAVILGISPKATIVDISHEIEKFNIRIGAYVLASAAPYFPNGTIHLAVVDPGVGTERQPIIVQTRHSFLVGPDNGVLALAAKTQGIKHIHKVANRKFMLPKISNTFHGRDVFAPAAAHLANGMPPTRFGPRIDEILMPKFAKVVRRKAMLVGEVLHVDGFGNIVTTFNAKDLELIGAKAIVDIEVKNARLKLKLCKAYAEVKKREPLAIIGSHNFLEIAINQGNAAKTFKTKSKDKITIYRP